MSKTLVFGGPALKEGQVTWYVTRRDGRDVQVHVRPGEEVQADSITNCDADRYVKAGQAAWKKQTRKRTDREGKE